MGVIEMTTEVKKVTQRDLNSVVLRSNIFPRFMEL